MKESSAAADKIILEVVSSHFSRSLAPELSCDKWLLGFATEPGQRPSTVSIPALEISRLWREISKAKLRFKLSPETPLVCLYEAGRDGFVLQRLLASEGHVCYVADSACILVNQRKSRIRGQAHAA